MAENKKVKVIFGSFPFFQWTKEVQEEFLALLKKYGVKDLDTARSYPDSEKILGEHGAPKDFAIHTKARAFKNGALTKDGVLTSAKESFDALKTEQVETYFLHSPDPQTPIDETMSAIQELYKAGKFKHFGLSNYSPEEVQAVYDVAKKNDWVLPTVYQGNYNPVARHGEDKLFPLLRKLNIAFYAYSPIAGGFLVQSSENFMQGTEGRFDDDKNPLSQLYRKLYNRKSLLDALKEWEDIAKEAGISKAALAYRWVAFNSALKAEHGDGIIIGASKTTQLQETLEALKDGPLDSKIAARIDKVWDSVKHEAPLDNYRSE